MSYITLLPYAQPLVNDIVPKLVSYAKPVIKCIPTGAMPYVPNILLAAAPYVVGTTVTKLVCVAGSVLLPESCRGAVQNTACVIGFVASILVIPSSASFVPLFTISAGKAFGLLVVATVVNMLMTVAFSILSPSIGNFFARFGDVVTIGLLGGNLWVPLRVFLQALTGCAGSFGYINVYLPQIRGSVIP